MWNFLEKSEALQNEMMVWKNRAYTYAWLKTRVAQWMTTLEERALEPGTSVHLSADFSPEAVALLLALADRRCIVSVSTQLPQMKLEECVAVAQAEVQVSLDAEDRAEWKSLSARASHPLLEKLRAENRAGLVLFSSGSSGKPKAIVHDFERLFAKFETPKKTMRTTAILLFDHVGGLNVLFYTLYNNGCLVVPADRTPAAVAAAIEAQEVSALVTTPTFLNLLLMSEARKRHSFLSLRVINYGSEVMPAATLSNLRQAFPYARLSQGYGMSEVGVLPSASRYSDSVFLRFKNEGGFATRVVNGMLEIQSPSMMLGYLNAPSPITEDGWLRTGDAVEVFGDQIRILGRISDLINVGGRKVYPAEVENVLSGMTGVEDVVVSSKRNSMLGQVVKATVSLSTGESLGEFRKRLREYCRTRLEAFKIPRVLVVSHGELYGRRMKKFRQLSDA
jgi:long-chain acyl-CoA synthetase